jgi:hypothetical protein
MKNAQYDRKLADLSLSIKQKELSTKHQKELNQLESDLAAKKNIGSRNIHELIESQLQEHLDVRLNCVVEAFNEGELIDEEIEKEIKENVGRFIYNQERGLIAFMESRLARENQPKATKESSLNGIKYIVSKHRSDFSEKLKVAILKHNKSIEKKSTLPLVRQDCYVDNKRIEELKNIKNSNFDLSKLIRFCEELNIAHKNQCYMSITMLVRSIINHVPPIFGKEKFIEVINNLSNTTSFKDSMNILDKSSRKIADSYLHSTVRQKESLPTFTQVNFSADLDILLSEIVRIL